MAKEPMRLEKHKTEWVRAQAQTGEYHATKIYVRVIMGGVDQ